MTRVFLDANIYISYLLRPSSEGPPATIVRAGLSGGITLVYADPTLLEILDKVVGKPYLASHISTEMVDTLLQLLALTGERVAELPGPFPAIGRDRKDDYLIAHSLISNVDYLVSGDQDLLTLGSVDDLRIVSPADFARILSGGDGGTPAG
jgi:putative PIN family toxin of toxin-antitoxin system